MPRQITTVDSRPLAILAGLWCALAIPQLQRVNPASDPAWLEVRSTAPPSVRELRRLPGIGPRRAQAIARHRWHHGPDFDLEAVPGIGPLTAAAVRAAQARDP